MSKDRPNRLLDVRFARVRASAAEAFAPIRRIGGEDGWYAYGYLWTLRGWLDRLVGGVGLQRKRPDPETLRVGDPLGFWRVEACEPDHLLRLRAEMKLPGQAWLQFEVEPDGCDATIRQTAMYEPQGLLGLIYWYSLFPAHIFLFGGMLRGIAERAEAGARDVPEVERQRASDAGAGPG